MKKLLFIAMLLVFTVATTSCASVEKVQNEETEVAGYTLKNKKEQLQQKILNNKSKTIYAIP